MKNRTTIQLSEELRKELKILAAKRDLSYQELLENMISVFRELDKEKSIVSIPSSLARKIEKKTANAGFSNASEYITHILRMIYSETIEKNEITKKDEEKVRKKLEKLGYTD